MVILIPGALNRVRNPSHEVDNAGWSAAEGSLTLDNAAPWTGGQHGKLTVTAAVPVLPFVNGAVGYASPYRTDVVAGEVTSAAVRVRALRANLVVRLQMTLRTAADANTATLFGPMMLLTDPTRYYTIPILGFLPPAGTAFGYPLLRCESTALPGGGVAPITGDTYYLDGWQLHPGDTLTEYVDGNLGAYHRWLGVPHQSASVRDPIPQRQTVARRGATRVTSKLYLADRLNGRLADITPEAITGKVESNVHNAIKMGLSLTGLNMGDIVPYTSYVAPVIELTDLEGYTQEHQLGLYVCTPAKRGHRQAYSTYSIEGRGLTWILANSYPTSPYTASQGSSPIANVVAILTNHGLRWNIPLTAAVLAESRTWDVDVSWLDICNTQLNGAGYYTLWDDRYGVLKSAPYFELAQAQPALQLWSGEGGIVTGIVEQEGVYDTLANQIIVLKENTGGNPIRVVRTNNDPSNPVSVPNLGRTIPRVIKDSSIISSTEARAIAKRAMEVGASYTNKLTVRTLPVPARDSHEVYDLALYQDDGAPVAFGLWWCDSWSIGFTAKEAQMTHSLKRLEPYGDSEVFT